MDYSSLITLSGITSLCLFILKPLLILVVCKIIISILLRLSDGVLSKTKLDLGIQSFVKSALKIGLWILVIIFVADSLGVNTASLVALVSVVSLALSLSVQNLMTNMFSGITILLSKPFVVGDFVEVSGVTGTVKEITFMRTTLITPDNKIELIPNADIANSKITNYSTEEFRRVDLKFAVSYDASTENVKRAILEVINADERVKTDAGHEAFVRISNYNANDIEYTVRLWVDNKNYWDVYFDTMEDVRESFARYDIEFSYPHTIVHMK